MERLVSLTNVNVCCGRKFKLSNAQILYLVQKYGEAYGLTQEFSESLSIKNDYIVTISYGDSTSLFVGWYKMMLDPNMYDILCNITPQGKWIKTRTSIV